jgi:hypothetical protein
MRPIMMGHILSQMNTPQILVSFCRCTDCSQYLTRSHRSACGQFFSGNTERSETVLKEELGNTRKALELGLGRNSSSPPSVSSQLSERLRSLPSTDANSQMRNNTLQDRLVAFQARESAMSKRISDLRGRINDLIHLQQWANRSWHAASESIRHPAFRNKHQRLRSFGIIASNKLPNRLLQRWRALSFSSRCHPKE